MLTKLILAVMAALLIAASSGELREELDDLQAERIAVTTDYENARAAVFESEERKAELERWIRLQENRVAILTGQANEVAVSIHKGTVRSQPERLVELLVNSETLSDASMLNYAQERQRVDIDLLEMQRRTLERQRRDYDLLVEQAAAEAAELEVAAQRLAELINKTESDIERAEQREARARAIEAARQLAQSRTNFADPGPPAPSRGNYACPLDPSVTSFIDSWGFPRSGGRRHMGTDIMGPMNSPVYAYTDGVISRHSNNRLGGISLYLVGEDGNTYYYAHLNGYTNDGAVGNVVSAGDHIAFNGSTGNASASAPHIHLEQHPAGNRSAAVNPYRGLAAVCF